MKKIFLLVSALTSMFVFAQIGINTATPKTTLDVVGKPADATVVDGVIIPRISGNELKQRYLSMVQTKRIQLFMLSQQQCSLLPKHPDIHPAKKLCHIGKT